MKLRTLGKTGMQVSELALGGLFVSNYANERANGIEVIHRALELGVNYIDTAPGYMDSESVIGDALRGVTQPVIISTKFGYQPEPFEPQNKDFLWRALEASMARLGREQIDMLMIHEPDRPDYFDWWTDKVNYSGPVLEVLQEAKAQGLTRFIGAAGTTPYPMARVLATGNFDVVLTAFQYSLLWREAEWEVLPTAAGLGMGIVCGSPLQQGWLSARFDDEVNNAPWLNLPRRRQFQALYSYLDEINLPITEVALRWVLSNPDVSAVLMGAKSIAEVEQNVAAVEKGPLPAEVLAALREIYLMVPFRPYEEPYGMPFGQESK
ncbi:MAG TPA: aldo/keto reductase [Armatimonadota bacterium]|jgi:aryl-alcohol dehydrogenase-like predicted oxidoreductase